MLITLWTVKGGSGVSVVAAGLASVFAAAARGTGDGALLIDLGGDQPALLGVAPTEGPGVSDWLAAPHGDREALRRLEVEVTPSLALLPTGDADAWPPDREVDLTEVLCAEGRAVVVDGGMGAPPVPGLADADLSLLVLRPCYLALRRAVVAGVRADGVVLVDEPGRSLDAVDVSRALGMPVLCSVAVDPTVARAVDAGLLATRLPRSFARALQVLT